MKQPCPPELHPNNLPRDLVQAICVCITLQAFANKPCHVQSIFDGLYGIGPEIGMHTVQEFTALMGKMHRSGLITLPNGDGEVILTDHGDEAATSFRSIWEDGGVLDVAGLMNDNP